MVSWDQMWQHTEISETLGLGLCLDLGLNIRRSRVVSVSKIVNILVFILVSVSTIISFKVLVYVSKLRLTFESLSFGLES